MGAESQSESQSEVLKLFDTVWAGGIIPQMIFVILVVMSMVSWFITFTKMFEQRALNKQYGDIQRESQKGGFWSGNLHDSVDKLKGKNHAYKQMAEEGLRAAEHHEGSLSDQMALHEWITISLQRSVDSISNRLTSGLWFLATTGSTAPFIGLLGTVVGIYRAMAAIAQSGQASIEKTAGPIGESLIMTALGLLVAVPAVFFYNVLIRRNKDVMEKTRFYASSLHSYLVSTTRTAARK
jgi:biopolymer transport protein ExbB